MKRAFTLIEILVIIAIICLLAAILFPVFNRVRERARQSTCMSNERQMGLALMQYVQDNDDTYPYGYSQNMAVDWKTAITPYTKSSQVSLCPSNPNRKLNYSYTGNTCNGYSWSTSVSRRNGVMGYQDTWGIMLPAKLAEMASPSDLIVVLETNWKDGTLQPANYYFNNANGPSGPYQSVALFAGHFGRTNYVFADGHVKALTTRQTLTAAEGGSSTLNMWRRDGRAFTNNGAWPDDERVESQKFFQLAEAVYSAG